MPSAPPVGGVHHVTALASDPQENVDFYAGVLGMRLVKRSVNQDDPGTYHLFYADGGAHPGSDLTFFPVLGGAPGRNGAGLVNEVALAIPPGSLAYWEDRLRGPGHAARRVADRFGERVLSARDPDALQLSLVESAQAIERPFEPWKRSPVPIQHQIRGIHAARVVEHDSALTTRFAQDVLGMTPIATDGEWARFAGRDRWSGYLEVRADPAAPRGAWGAGTVHHVAWRVRDDEEQAAARDAVAAAGRHPTPVIDRFWFRSVYFREPGGVLFEIATDGPGFGVDEPMETLGESLVLPPWLEPHRAAIEARLPPIALPHEAARTRDLGFKHVWIPAPDAGAALTLLLLHGTGADERDLLPLARQLDPDANVLSPRGKVLENGMPRFFRRLAEGVFDLEDLHARTQELADLARDASKAYSFDGRRVVAFGYSNGANIAGSVLLERPEALRGAILARAMVPFEPERAPMLAGKDVLLLAGERDPYSQRATTERLAEILRDGGARVEVSYAPAGHELTPGDIETARGWLQKLAL